MPYQQLTLNTPSKDAQLMLTAVDQDFSIGTLTIPTFTQPLTAAYLDIYINSFQNTSANDNFVNALSQGKIGWDYLGTFRSAHTASVGLEFRTPASAWRPGLYVLTCENNMKSYIASGGSYNVYFHNYSAAFANLYLWGIFAQLRMYFNVS
jgi:hypothetical protein